MRFIRAKALFWVGIIILAAFGCSKKVEPLPPLAADQIPVEFQKTFSRAKPAVKAMADKVLADLQNKDYPTAYSDVQLIGNAPEADKSQRLLAVRASLTIYQLLAAAQAQGDQRSAAAVEMIKKYK